MSNFRKDEFGIDVKEEVNLGKKGVTLSGEAGEKIKVEYEVINSELEKEMEDSRVGYCIEDRVIEEGMDCFENGLINVKVVDRPYDDFHGNV